MALSAAIPKLLALLARTSFRSGRAGAKTNRQFDEYETRLPSHQNAIDMLPGWNMAFPPEFGLSAGDMNFYSDPRILWLIEQTGPLAGKSVLEIGPLEGAHTRLLDNQNPAVLHCVEANKRSYLRCLVAKEIYQFRSARFFLGDAQIWLEERPQHYDLVVASGVLYHMQDPLRLLESIAARTDSLFLWTHYADEGAMPPGDPRRRAFLGPPEIQHRRGLDIRLHPRSYLGAWKNTAFCGGMHDLHRWIERADLLAFLLALGFSDIRISGDEPAQVNGPAFCVLARRSNPQHAALP